MMFGALVGSGMAVALLSAATAHMVSVLSDESTVSGRALLISGLLALIGGVAGLRVFERYLAEKLGQDYVHEIRKELVRSALAPGRTPSLGITVARTSNDLNSVRNWVTLGIASAASGVPLIIVLTAALWFMTPPLAVAVMAPLLVAALVLGFLARPTLTRAAMLRKVRGRLAGQIADTVNAARAIRAGGGENRELGRIDKLGQEVAASAVRRATFAGSLRASAAAAASATAVAVAATGAFIGLDHGHVAAALTVVSMIATPVHDLGRIVEFRQSFLAARNSIAPALRQEYRDRPRVERERSTQAADRGHAGTLGPSGAAYVSLLVADVTAERLEAHRGECVRAVAQDHAVTDRLFAEILGSAPEPLSATTVEGVDLAAMQPSRRRQFLGYAERGLDLERGQLGRAIRYRCPDADERQFDEAVARVGLGSVVSRLPKGAATVLRRGGEPLSTPEKAKVQLARAALGSPALLLLNRIDADLDTEGRAALSRILRDYPGVAIVATDHPEILPPKHREWHIDRVGEGGSSSVQPSGRLAAGGA